MKINELTMGTKKVALTGTITEKGEARLVQTRFGKDSRVCNAVLTDDSGKIKLTLWDRQIDDFGIGDIVTVGNGYVTAFRGEPQLNVGRFGVIRKGAS